MATPPPPDFTAYHLAIAEARARGLTLQDAQARSFVALLVEHVRGLEDLVKRGLARGRELATVRREALRLVQQLVQDLEAQVKGGALLTTRSVAELHARATVQLVAQLGDLALVDAAAAAMARVALPAYQAVTARAELTAAMKSIRADAVEAADRVLRRAVLDGGGDPDTLARALRLQLLGAEGFPPDALRDLRRIGYGTLKAMGLDPTPANLALVKEQGGRIARRARLIARTEIMAAEHEAGVRAAAESPVVGLLKWVLSGRHPEEDECDALADLDWYGHGVGLYLPEQFPLRPHPRCLCGRVHVLRDPREWHTPKQTALSLLRRDPDGVGEELQFYPSRTRSLRRALAGGAGVLPARLAA